MLDYANIIQKSNRTPSFSCIWLSTTRVGAQVLECQTTAAT